MALCCDIRIASANSTFGIPAAKLGLAYGFNGIKLLTSIVGPAKAKYIFFTARKFNALQAKEFGILEEVYSIKDLDLNSNLSIVQTKFKTLVKKFHPDRNAGNKEFEDKLKKITLAYSHLRLIMIKK